jgi:exopolyphosphatase/guanosine-5'-triphosphate,3'-diphosphate pyrophosphatase
MSPKKPESPKVKASSSKSKSVSPKSASPKAAKSANKKSETEHTRQGSWAKVSGGPVFACIDMGTNSFHMIVCRATPDKEDFEVLTKVKEIAPFFRRSLGAHYIDDVAFDNAKTILREMLKQAQSKGATHVQAVATSAVRESRNGHETIERIRQELKLDARTISGKEEARLIYLGVLFSMPELKDRFVVVDIGGGSTEIVAADRQRAYFAESYKLGGARLTQRFFKKGFPTQESLKELHVEVTGMLKPAAARIETVGGYQRVIGTSGTVQALAKLDRVQTGRTNEPLHGWRMPIERLAEIVAYIERCSVGGERIKGVSQDRSQTILAGAIVLLETLRALKATEITVCSSALREGVVVDRFLQTGWLNGALKSHNDPRSASVHHLLEKYDSSFAHAEQVAKLATAIFQQTKGILHNYDEEVGHILWSAAMLHDVGTFIARNGHHKHSYYLIRHGGLLGHSEEQVEMIASIARYHRGATPKDSHEAWQSLNSTAQPIVQDLAAILRVAEALDRSHRQLIKDIKVMMNPYQGTDTGFGGKLLSLVPFVKDGENCRAEAWALNEKKEYFESRFGVKLHFLIEASQAVR